MNEQIAFLRGALLGFIEKQARKSQSFLKKDYPEKAKDVYRALKREHGESMPAEVKARIALATAKGKRGGPYSDPLHYKRSKGRYVKKSSLLDTMLKTAEALHQLFEAKGE